MPSNGTKRFYLHIKRSWRCSTLMTSTTSRNGRLALSKLELRDSSLLLINTILAKSLSSFLATCSFRVIWVRILKENKWSCRLTEWMWMFHVSATTSWTLASRGRWSSSHRQTVLGSCLISSSRTKKWGQLLMCCLTKSSKIKVSKLVFLDSRKKHGLISSALRSIAISWTTSITMKLCRNTQNSWKRSKIVIW